LKVTKTNLYLPTSEFNLNVKENKKNHPVLFLMKKDPELPFGDIMIQVLFREMADHEHYYGPNDLEFDEDSQPNLYEVPIPVSESDELLREDAQTEEAEQ
jgi:hypothetical protein